MHHRHRASQKTQTHACVYGRKRERESTSTPSVMMYGDVCIHLSLFQRTVHAVGIISTKYFKPVSTKMPDAALDAEYLLVLLLFHREIMICRFTHLTFYTTHD